jgi:hypothetical protein
MTSRARTPEDASVRNLDESSLLTTENLRFSKLQLFAITLVWMSEGHTGCTAVTRSCLKKTLDWMAMILIISCDVNVGRMHR